MTPHTRLLCALLIGLAAVLWWTHTRAHLPPTAPPTPTPDAPTGTSRTADTAAAHDIATTCDLVALALTSGIGVNEALDAVSAISAPAPAAALRCLLAGRHWGVDDTDDAHILPARWAPLTRALRLADHGGIPPSNALLRAATDTRTRARHHLDIATARLRITVVLPLGLCFLPAFVLTSVVPIVLTLAVGIARP
ncbi:hypothetical protein KEM60_01087 [Austwickia sp. TVS 96-490-7B]|uniref:type II secretion system F family protein n=1 Tax=Austwickia sp. TVS 96-490-7B TaxID=2830843 RepID=UPI001C56E01A|nr:type II secretion system F family protein [Austwickia sp. TVS 96-490-7B]MBW3084897.1 hypothetical protein [Austwickia sp. TVS 96-490-7B]